MLLLAKKIINLPVETKSGVFLGKVINFAIDINIQSITEYYIKPDSVLTDLIRGKLIINRGQIIEMTDKKIIVDDLVIKDKTTNKAIIKKEAPQGALLKNK